jgi:hypothetical protein
VAFQASGTTRMGLPLCLRIISQSIHPPKGSVQTLASWNVPRWSRTIDTRIQNTWRGPEQKWPLARKPLDHTPWPFGFPVLSFGTTRKVKIDIKWPHRNMISCAYSNGLISHEVL